MMVNQHTSSVVNQAREIALERVAEQGASRFAKWVFMSAAVYGLIILLAQYFMEEQNGLRNPPAITHPEYYYGFIGVALAWQVLFLILAQNPVRYRPMMLPAILEKATFGIAAIVLFAQQRLSAEMLGAGLIDLVLGILFVAAYIRTARHAADTPTNQA